VARHTPGHRVDGEHHFDALLFERACQVTDCVLGLRHRHAVAGDDGDPLRGLKDDGNLVS